MATQLFYPVPAVTSGNASATTYAVTAGGTQAVVVGHNNFVRIVGTTAINVRFGPTGTVTATANDIYLPANVVEIFDMGRHANDICIYAVANSSVNVAIISKNS